MYSLQKLLPKTRANLKPGIFSNHSRLGKSIQCQDSLNNNSQDTSQQLSTHDTNVKKNHQAKPSKYNSDVNIKKKDKENQEPKDLLQQFQNFQNSKNNQSSNQIVVPNLCAFIQQKNQSSPKHKKKQLSQDKNKPNNDPKKLNFNGVTPKKEEETVFLNKTNQMANMIIENILNKEDYYEKIKQENADLKEQQQSTSKQLLDLKKKLQNIENESNKYKQALQEEREKYQKELLKIHDQVNIFKNQQCMEKLKNEAQSKTITDLTRQIQHFKEVIGNIGLAGFEYLGICQDLLQSQDIENAVQTIQEMTEKTQNFNLPALNDISVSFDFADFFNQMEEQLVRQASQSELSFRQKGEQNEQESRKITLQEQFNKFLEDEKVVDDNQLGSPYFTQLQFPEKKNDNLPRQIANNAQQLILQRNRFETDFSDGTQEIKKQQLLDNFLSFNQNNHQISNVQHQTEENETTMYDSLVKEMNKNDKRMNSLHTLKQIDEQSERNKIKSIKSSNRDSAEHCQDAWAIGKFDYKAQKVVYSIFQQMKGKGSKFQQRRQDQDTKKDIEWMVDRDNK